MKKALTAMFILLLLMTVGGCQKYNKNDFIGKTSAEIIEEFGDFDCITMPISDDGLYRNCSCGYTVREPRKGFLGTSPEELFFIQFDENGMAVNCSVDYRPGG